MAPRPPIQAVIEEQAELDAGRRRWRMVLFNPDGSVFGGGGSGGDSFWATDDIFLSPVGDETGVEFGGDTNLFRSGANQLATDDDLFVRQGVAGQVVVGDIFANGTAGLILGSDLDVNLFRQGANQLKTDDNFTSGGWIAGASDVAAWSEGANRVVIGEVGPAGQSGISFRNGEIRLYRAVANVLQLDKAFVSAFLAAGDTIDPDDASRWIGWDNENRTFRLWDSNLGRFRVEIGNDDSWNFGAGDYIKLLERDDPSAPAGNRVAWYARDNGSGKTQLCARFSTGAVQVIATEP